MRNKDLRHPFFLMLPRLHSEEKSKFSDRRLEAHESVPLPVRISRINVAAFGISTIEVKKDLFFQESVAG